MSFEAPFAPTCLAHPNTYLNKVVLGGADGSMQLWNFVTGQHVFSFKGW
jgi:U3 small nucleolar RNA-associated protein 21